MFSDIKIYFYGAAAVLLLFCGYEVYTLGEAHTQALWDADKAARQVEFNAQLLEQANKIKQSETQHEKDLSTIASAVAAASGVRVVFPSCPKPMSTAAQTSPSSNGTSGVVQPTMDGLFAEFQARVGKIIERCDKLNVDTIELNSRL